MLGFGVEDRDRVDEIYRDLVAAGSRGQQPPYDAFWGARYAVVACSSLIATWCKGKAAPTTPIPNGDRDAEENPDRDHGWRARRAVRSLGAA